MIDQMLHTRFGRGLRWRVLPEWPWLSLQVVALWLVIQTGTLLDVSWMVRAPVLLVLAFIALEIAGYVSDAVDDRLRSSADAT